MAGQEDKAARMVERQIAARGIRDERVLAAMREVPREAFVPENLREFAHDDTPLPIAEGQTISQPYIVALMADAAGIGPLDRVLDVGTGSGYPAAGPARPALRGRGPVPPRRARLLDRAPRLPRRGGTPAPRGAGLHERRGQGRRRQPGLARGGTLRRHPGRGRGAGRAGRAEEPARDRRPAGDPGGRRGALAAPAAPAPDG